jgi:alkylation response protein AidB-like acyl-CoA dehydrogenase
MEDPRTLFDDEVIPVLRRLAERPRGRSTPLGSDVVEVRAAVWRALAGLGAFEGTSGLRALAPLVELIGVSLHQSPLLDTLAAAELTTATAEPVALAVRAAGRSDPRHPGPLSVDAGTLTGTRSFVGFAADVDRLLVVADTGCYTVTMDQPGVRVRRQDDVGRSDYYEVSFVDARFTTVDSSVPWSTVLDRTRLRHALYLTGLCSGALELSLGYARERRVFGQPLARFQAPAFKLAGFAARLEAARTLAYQACVDADAGEPVGLPAAQVLLLAGELAIEVSAEAIQIHGAYGLTERCDAQLFYRRALVDAQLWGTRTQLLRDTAGFLAPA